MLGTYDQWRNANSGRACGMGPRNAHPFPNQTDNAGNGSMRPSSIHDAGPANDRGWPHRQTGAASLSTVIYRSRAVRDMSPPALRDLTISSQRRNSRDAITGLMLYDNGQFFQWLEGPPGNVDRLMGDIHQDSRHTGIEILTSQSVASRSFGDWSMKLAANAPGVENWQFDVIAPPAEMVEDLRRRPHAAPVLLTRLAAPMQASHDSATPSAPGAGPLKLSRGSTESLKAVILSIVIPQLCGSVLPAGLRQSDARAAELAQLLLKGEETAAIELIREMQKASPHAGMLYAALLEPAARRLGDLWSEDECSEFDLTLGLCRLQTAARLLASDQDGMSDCHTGPALPLAAQLPGGLAAGLPADLPTDLPTVLIVPEPGEMHLLGAVLDDRVLSGAGWAPQSEFPRTDQALQDLVSGSWFDVLDLSLSVALRRDHWLPRVRETIAAARRASRNPALLVVVGGRLFLEQNNAGTNVGANLTSKTAGNVDQSILRSISGTKTIAASLEPLTTVTPS